MKKILIALLFLLFSGMLRAQNNPILVNYTTGAPANQNTVIKYNQQSTPLIISLYNVANTDFNAVTAQNTINGTLNGAIITATDLSNAIYASPKITFLTKQKHFDPLWIEVLLL